MPVHRVIYHCPSSTYFRNFVQSEVVDVHTGIHRVVRGVVMVDHFASQSRSFGVRVYYVARRWLLSAIFRFGYVYLRLSIGALRERAFENCLVLSGGQISQAKGCAVGENYEFVADRSRIGTCRKNQRIVCISGE